MRNPQGYELFMSHLKIIYIFACTAIQIQRNPHGYELFMSHVNFFLIDSNAQPNHSFKENRISLQNKNDKRRGSQLHSGYQQ